MITGMKKRAPAAKTDITSFESEIKRVLPQDYVELLSTSNGANGLQNGEPLILYDLPEVVKGYSDYRTFIPNLLVFGSDGSGEEFAFDYRHDPPTVVRLPGIPLDEALTVVIADSFTDFLAHYGDKRNE
jgi:cell wall assembly regulator SMI1